MRGKLSLEWLVEKIRGRVIALDRKADSPGPPWGWQPSLKQMAEEVGVDFDVFLAGIKNGFSDEEIAAEVGVGPRVIARLREHFQKFGIDSVIGQD
ncbi:MAG: Uncharacterized protein XD63_1457 [Thermoanaerobacterales bacterium 50_218]|nr:MAG: Uncharacterized protein XD63_1457 [Thermoanaerobacterales bacterium 50_218]HAA89653.1 hypothetical protein [Peptococcaceae bacterium]